ncbi:histidine N-acetyltransferase-like [Bufo gargarizans]|uniref:histidine N-acetyltransferase-like n=1 Tax=Bufo gargarizans TaxID=30331 RepID=UPI001CF141C3|nr:histidine N-acetyltransferase-like [Bufo gargarizans]
MSSCMVGFESFIVVDDGTTAVVEDLRVAAEMRRRGVGGVIRRFCWGVMRSDYPEVKRVRSSVAGNSSANMVETCKRITCKAVIPVLVTADQLEAKLRLLESRVNNEDRSKKLSVLGPEEILRFLEESKTREQLLPGGFLVQSWSSIAAQKSNLDLLLKREIVWIYSHPEDSSDSASSSKVTPGSNGPQASPEGFLSLGSQPYPVPFADRLCYIDIDLFGNDPSCAKVHVLEQLKIRALGVLYDEPDRVSVAESNHKALTQGNRPVEDYCMQFRKWSYDCVIDLMDEEKRWTFLETALLQKKSGLG